MGVRYEQVGADSTAWVVLGSLRRRSTSVQHLSLSSVGQGDGRLHRRPCLRRVRGGLAGSGRPILDGCTRLGGWPQAWARAMSPGCGRQVHRLLGGASRLPGSIRRFLRAMIAPLDMRDAVTVLVLTQNRSDPDVLSRTYVVPNGGGRAREAVGALRGC